MEFESFMQAAIQSIAGIKTVLVKAGGVFNAAFAVFHLTFWHLFSWREDLRALTFVNRGIIQVLNLCLVVVFAIFSFLSLVHTQELISSPLGHSLIALIALFWLARAVEQVVFFRLRHWGSWVLLLAFFLGVLLYGLPAAAIFWPSPSST